LHHADVRLTDGTIVTINFSVADGRLAGVTVGGTPHDFAASLERLPADTEAAAIAARVRAAVPFGSAFPAGAARDIASAVRKALGPTTAPRLGSFTANEIDALTERWTTFPWRIIPEQPHPAALNVAIDEILSDVGAPCLRFWKWAEPAVVIGRCQSVENEVDREAMAEAGVSLVRRLTGGGAMFVQPHGTITYSLILPENAVAGLTIRQSYEVCDAWVVRGLRALGIDAHHVPVNDIACGEGKIGGAAQSRRRGTVLHHTTIAYALDSAEMARVLRIGRAKPRANAVASAAKVVSPLASQTNLPREEIVEHLRQTFQRTYGGTPSPITAGEHAAATELVRTKYGRADWTHEFP
jgi:lipoate---protein ligase